MICGNCGMEMQEMSHETQMQTMLGYWETEYMCPNCGRREKTMTTWRCIFNGKTQKKDKISEDKKEVKENKEDTKHTHLGLIDREGYIHECEYWGHETLSQKIIEDRGWSDEYSEFKKEHKYGMCAEDFLTHKKGYISVTHSMSGRFRNVYYFMTPSDEQRKFIKLFEQHNAEIFDYRYMNMPLEELEKELENEKKND